MFLSIFKNILSIFKNILSSDLPTKYFTVSCLAPVPQAPKERLPARGPKIWDLPFD